MLVIILDVKTGPAGLVVVTYRVDGGPKRQLILPARLAGVAEVEWAATAAATLTQLQSVPA